MPDLLAELETEGFLDTQEKIEDPVKAVSLKKINYSIKGFGEILKSSLLHNKRLARIVVEDRFLWQE